MMAMRGRHQSSPNDVRQLRRMLDDGALRETLAKEDIQGVINDIEKLENDENAKNTHRRDVYAHVKEALKNRHAPAAGAAAGAGGNGGGGNGGGGGGGGENRGAAPFVAPATLAQGVERIIQELKAPGSAVYVRRSAGGFTVLYRGQYVKSYCWYMRQSTSWTLRLALNRAWLAHFNGTGQVMPRGIKCRIESLNISRFNIGGF
jgi:hypothetical protein